MAVTRLVGLNWVPFLCRTINIPDDGCKLLPACACAVTGRYKMRRNTVLLKRLDSLTRKHTVILHKIGIPRNPNHAPPCWDSVAQGMSMSAEYEVLFFTQENAADLHSVGRIPLHSRRRSGEECKSCQNNESLILHDPYTVWHLLGISLIASVK